MFWRNSNSELWDILGIFFLFFGITLILLRTTIGAKILEQIQSLKDRLQIFLESVELGLDFRPQKQQVPSFTRMEKSVFLILGTFIVTLFYQISLPFFLDRYLLKFSAVFYLILLSLIWGGTLTFVFVLGFTGISSLWEILFHRYPKMNRYFILGVLLVLFMAVLLSLKAFLSPLLSLGIVILLSLTPYLLLHGYESERPYLLYGFRGKTPIHSLALIQWLKSYMVCSALFAGLWGCLLIGTRDQTDIQNRYPTTQFLAEVFLWFWCLQRSYFFYHLYLWKKEAPSQFSKKIFWVDQKGHFSIVPELLQALKKQNWKLLYRKRLPAPDEADIKLGFQSAKDRHSCGVPDIILDAEQLKSESTAFTIDRKDRLQKKRQFLRGMKKLFKIGNAQENKSGDGYILGPWWWLTQGLRRNEEEFSFQNYFNTFIGPHFQVLYRKPIRQYIYQIFRSIDIDFLYLEDGVSFNGFKKVMDAILEHYDMKGPGHPIEERHFLQLNGIKVIIDEFGSEERRFSSSGYPEPEFTGISRARIMQIFKDRGDQKDDDEPPQVSCEDDYEWLRDALDKTFPSSTHSNR
ncbi:MAG: hypothetical protein AABZ60_05850 [Planctomycetota bacterium]